MLRETRFFKFTLSATAGVVGIVLVVSAFLRKPRP